MAHPYSANTTTTVAPATPDLRGLLAAASHHLGAALGALALHDNVTLAAADTTADNDSLINFCEASLARLSLAEPQTAMELDTTAMELDLSVPRLRHRESPKERVARRKLLHTGAKPKKLTTTCSSSATAASSSAADPAAVLLIDRTLAPARNVRARGF